MTYRKTVSRAQPLRPQLEDQEADSLSIETALELIKRNPHRAAKMLRLRQTKAHAGARMMDYIVAGAAYGLADRASKNKKFRRRFLALRFFERYRKKVKPHNLLSYTLRFVYGSHEKAVADRARDHAIALKGCWDDKTPAVEIPGILFERGGFDGLKRENAAARLDDNSVDGDKTFGDDLLDAERGLKLVTVKNPKAPVKKPSKSQQVVLLIRNEDDVQEILDAADGDLIDVQLKKSTRNGIPVLELFDFL